jgi:alpha/beta superfamily hydrolase
LEALVQHPDSNVLIIFGDRDVFTSQSNYTTWASGLKGNVKIVEVKGASHFWGGRSGHELGEIINKWL